MNFREITAWYKCSYFWSENKNFQKHKFLLKITHISTYTKNKVLLLVTCTKNKPSASYAQNGEEKKKCYEIFNLLPVSLERKYACKTSLKVGRRTIGLSGAQFESHQTKFLEPVMP